MGSKQTLWVVWEGYVLWSSIGVSSAYLVLYTFTSLLCLSLDAGCPDSRRRAARSGVVPPLRPGRPLPGLCAAQQGRRLRGVLPARRVRRRERLLQVSTAVPSLTSLLKANLKAVLDTNTKAKSKLNYFI